MSRKVYLLRRVYASAHTLRQEEGTHARTGHLDDAQTPAHSWGEEIEALYGRPYFTPEERQEYFAFSPPEKVALEQFHSLPSRLYCMLQLGYFKARQLFVVFSLRDVEEDGRYLQNQYFPTARFRAVEITKVTGSGSSGSFWPSATIATVMP
jgi:Domain of unknown function (DUF4158)